MAVRARDLVRRGQVIAMRLPILQTKKARPRTMHTPAKRKPAPELQ
jgi:hypothetical protein